ncbi:MAG: class I SAM-dependent methyltransferase [Deltaproteobacteria bacterium]|nr:class I SAM-dependent methyltransferase [Deltaproteobacteria bacterium]
MLLDDCPICGSGNLANVYRVKDYTVTECNECGLVFVRDDVPTDEIKRVYGTGYFKNPAWCNTVNEDELLGYDDYADDKKNIRDKFEKILDITKRYAQSGPLLDVGCGLGFFLQLAKERGFGPVQGVDISAYAVDYCVNKLGLDALLGDLLDVQLTTGSFDIVTMFDVLEHFKNPKGELLEAYRIVRHNGFLAIITPDIGALIPKLLKDRWEEIKRVPEHLVFFSRRTLTNVLSDTGFHVVESRYIGKRMSFGSFLSHVFVNTGIKINLKRVPSINIGIPVNPFYKLLLIARKV